MPDRHRVRRAAWLAVGVVAATFAGACGSGDDGGDGDEAASGTTAQGATSTTTTTSETTTTTVAAEGPEEWIEAVRDVNERDFALLSDPDPGRLAEIYSATCECWDDQLGTVEFLAERGERFEGEPPIVLSVRHEGALADGAVHQLTVEARTNPMRRIDADGNVVQELPASEPSCMSLGLRADGPDGAWRVHSQTTLPECPEAS